MTNYILHLYELIVHKWYVFVAGSKLGCSFRRLILHDLSDFFRYQTTSFTDSRKKYDWRYYVYLNNKIQPYVVEEIPEVYVYEMVADWMASIKRVGRCFSEIADWYDDNKEFMIIHPSTNNFILAILEINGYFISKNKDLNDLLKQATRPDHNTNTPNNVISGACRMVGIDKKTTENIIKASDKLDNHCFWCNTYHPKDHPCLGKRNNW